MSIDKDSKSEIAAAPVERPPAVSECIWALIPEGSHARYRKHAARQLRRAFHPETSIIDLLLREQVCTDTDIERALDAEAAETFIDSERSSSSTIPDIDRGPRPVRAPLWPFAGKAPDRSGHPVGEIGSILQGECEFEVQAAAEAEWQILRAIARDPSFVRKDPANIRFLECSLPREASRRVAAAITYECDCVIADIRRRQDEGDASAMAWLDPETLLF